MEKRISFDILFVGAGKRTLEPLRAPLYEQCVGSSCARDDKLLRNLRDSSPVAYGAKKAQRTDKPFSVLFGAGKRT